MIVGCGGIGAWAVRLLQQAQESDLLLVDRDVVKSRNLLRQPFRQRDIRKTKASALARRNDTPIESWIQEVDFDKLNPKPDWLLSCVDNHPARAYTLDLSDRYSIPSIVAGNEVESYQVLVYKPAWKGTPRDPRVAYPEIESDLSDDPTKPGCSDEQRQGNAQSVLANYMAAGMLVRLLTLWQSKVKDLTDEELNFLVNEVNGNLFKTRETYYALNNSSSVERRDTASDKCALGEPVILEI